MDVSEMPRGRHGQGIPSGLSSATLKFGTQSTDWHSYHSGLPLGLGTLASFSMHPCHGSRRHFPFLYTLVALIL